MEQDVVVDGNLITANYPKMEEVSIAIHIALTGYDPNTANGTQNESPAENDPSEGNLLVPGFLFGCLLGLVIGILLTIFLKKNESNKKFTKKLQLVQKLEHPL